MRDGRGRASTKCLVFSEKLLVETDGGPEVRLGRRGVGFSWDQTDFDEGHSSDVFSKTTGRRNGVTWFLKQNKLQNQGVAPEVWVSALFSGSSWAPYVVGFAYMCVLAPSKASGTRRSDSLV